MHKDVDVSCYVIPNHKYRSTGRSQGVVGDVQELYIAICYFPHIYSNFAPLYDDSIGNFNAHTKDEQTTTFETNEAMYGQVMVEEVGRK